MLSLPHQLPTHLGRSRIQTLNLLATVFVFTISTTQSIYVRNVAIGRPTKMDSFSPYLTPVKSHGSNCVDNRTEYTIAEKSCCRTDKNTHFPNWWAVDLLREYDIYQVVIRNSDNDVEALVNFTIDAFKKDPTTIAMHPLIYGQVCAHQPNDDTFPPSGQTKAYPCTRPVRGRFLRVVKYTEMPLLMCEVQVMAPAFVADIYFKKRLRDRQILSPAFFTQTDVRSYIDCASLCVHKLPCNSFTWKEPQRECGLHAFSPYQNDVHNQTFAIAIGTDFTFN